SRRAPRRPAAPPRASHALPHGDPTCEHGTACDAHHPGVRSAAVRRRPDPGASSEPEETLMARTSFRTSVAAVLGVAGTAVGALAAHDLTQKRHTILRIYPVIGHMRYLLAGVRPELQPYLNERNLAGTPFDRDVRSIDFERAKGIHGEQAFGTERDVNAALYEYLVHSIHPAPEPERPPRVQVGGPDCTRPYSLALLNVSAMSFGALSANAVRALNQGAHQGGSAQDTGEGALPRHHEETGAA